MKKGTIYLTISSLIFVFSAYLTNIYLGRYLGPADYGTYGLVISIMTIINLIQTSGVPQAVSKMISEDTTRTETILKKGLEIQIVSTLIISLVYYLLSSKIAYLLKDNHLIPYLKLSAFILPTYSIYAFFNGYYNGTHNFKKQAMVGIVYSAVKTISVIGLSLVFKIYGAISGFIIAPLASLLFAFKLPGNSSQNYSYRKIILTSLPLIGFSLFLTALQSIDLYFVKIILNSNDLVGYYSANQNIARIPFFALSSFSAVLFPSISTSVGENDFLKTKRIIHYSLRYILLLLVPLVTLLIFSSRDILILLYSDRYIPAAPTLIINIAASAFITLFSIMGNIINGAGGGKQTLYISLTGVIIASLLCPLLIPRFQLSGAAIATGAGGFFTAAIAYTWLANKFRPLLSIKEFVLIICASLLPAFIIFRFNVPVIVMAIQYLIFITLYLTLLLIFRVITPKEITNVKNRLTAGIHRLINAK